MAQFDIHRNLGPLRASIPFVVTVQSSFYDDYRRRVVVPLVRRSVLPRRATAPGARMNPVFRVGGMDVVLHPLDIVSVPLDRLGERVGTLADRGQQITDALDELFSRSFG